MFIICLDSLYDFCVFETCCGSSSSRVPSRLSLSSTRSRKTSRQIVSFELIRIRQSALKVKNTNPKSSLNPYPNLPTNLNFLSSVIFLLKISKLHQNPLPIFQHHFHHSMVSCIQFTLDIPILSHRNSIRIQKPHSSKMFLHMREGEILSQMDIVERIIVFQQRFRHLEGDKVVLI